MKRYEIIKEKEGTDDLLVIVDTATEEWIAHVPCWYDWPRDRKQAERRAKLVCDALNARKV